MRVSYQSTVAGIAEACSGKITAGDPSAVIQTVTTDSRDLGTKSLFIPLLGDCFDGHDFINELLENKKIESYLTMKKGYSPLAEMKKVSEIFCDDTLKALGAIASSHRTEINPEVVGITGTNGKTTTKELAYTVLSSKYTCLKNEKNYNNEIGVPMTLLQLHRTHRVAVIEMGMNHAGELDRLSRIARPDIAMITSVGAGHLEYLETVENVALAKSEIMHGMKAGSTLLANREMPVFNIIRDRARGLGITLKTFGLSAEADVRPASYRLNRESLEVRYGGVDIAVPLYGLHNIYNVIAAIALAEEYGIRPVDVRSALKNFVNVGGRSSVIDRGFIVIDDTYNANPESLRYALLSAGEAFPERRKIAVLGDMKELGESAVSLHIESGKEVARNGFAILCAVGEMAEYYSEGAAAEGMAEENLLAFKSKEKLSSHLSGIVDKEDIVLVKGSRAMKMEEIVNALTGGE